MQNKPLKTTTPKLGKKLLLLAPASSSHTFKWATALQDRGYDVVLVSRCSSRMHPYPSSIPVYAPPRFLRGKLISFLPCALFFIWQQFKWRPDIVHAHFLTSYGNLAALLSRSFMVSVWGKDIFNLEERSWLVKYLSLRTLSRAKHILSTSKIMAKKTAEYTERPISVTPFGVDTQVFSPAGHVSEKNVLKVGCIKWLDEKYGISDALEAFHILIQQRNKKNLQLVLTGGGKNLEYYKDKAADLGIAEQVQFLGQVPYRKIPQTHQSLDIAIYPSTEDSDSFGVSILESSAAGLPVVASKIGGLPEVVVDQQTGFLVEPNAPTELAEAIARLCDNASLRHELGAAGRKFVEAQYSWPACVDRLESIYTAY